MKKVPVQLAAMWLFVIGFLCANSGWAPTLSILLSDRPDWSVCGQDLCLCTKPTPTQPACSLCPAADTAATCAAAEPVEPDNTPSRVPRNPKGDAVTQSAQFASVSVFIALVSAERDRARAATARPAPHGSAEPDARLALSRPGTPTPPPRA